MQVGIKKQSSLKSLHFHYELLELRTYVLYSVNWERDSKALQYVD